MCTGKMGSVIIWNCVDSFDQNETNVQLEIWKLFLAFPSLVNWWNKYFALHIQRDASVQKYQLRSISARATVNYSIHSRMARFHADALNKVCIVNRGVHVLFGQVTTSPFETCRPYASLRVTKLEAHVVNCNNIWRTPTPVTSLINFRISVCVP